MSFLCSQNSKVKDQRKPDSAAAAARGKTAATTTTAAACPATDGKQRTRATDAKVAAANDRVWLKRRDSAPMTVTEQRRAELRQRRMKELPGYQQRTAKPKKTGLSRLFARKDKDKDALRYRDDDGDLGKQQSTLFLDEFTFQRDNEASAATLDVGQESDAGSFAAGTSPFVRSGDGGYGSDRVHSPPRRRHSSAAPSLTTGYPAAAGTDVLRSGSSPESCPFPPDASHSSSCLRLSSGIPHPSEFQSSLASFAVNNGSARRSGGGGSGRCAREVHGTYSSSPLPTCLSGSQSQGYYMYNRFDAHRGREVCVRSNVPPPRARSLDSFRPAPLKLAQS